MSAKPNSPNSSQGRQQTLPHLQTLRQILDHIGAVQWDILLVGDGSGTGWKTACGWAGVMVQRRLLDPMAVWGGFSHGSVNLAEQMPYVQALLWHYGNGGRDLIKEHGPQTVHIVTDSKTVAQHGTQASDASRPLPQTQEPLWAVWRSLQHIGYLTHFHWAERSSSLLNWCADLIATPARQAVQYARQPVTPDELAQLRRLQRTAEVSSRGTDQPLLQQLSRALAFAVAKLGSTADATALRLDDVNPMVDPRNGQPIPLRDLVPDHTPSD